MLEPVLARAFPVARAVIVFEIIVKFGFVLPDLQSGIEERVICSRRKAGTPAVVFRAMQAAVHKPSRSACESGFREIATLLRKDPTTGGVCRERAGLTFGFCSFAPSLMAQVLTALNWDLAAHLNIECHRCFAKSRRFPLCTKCHLPPSVAARRR
jgi:hypothetical protein